MIELDCKKDFELIENEIKNIIICIYKTKMVNYEKITFFGEKIASIFDDSTNKKAMKVITKIEEKNDEDTKKKYLNNLFQLIYDNLKALKKFDIEIYLNKDGSITKNKLEKEQIKLYKRTPFSQMYFFDFINEED